MIDSLSAPFKEGFFGAFKLAFALVLSVVGVVSVFVKGGGDAAVSAAKHLRDERPVRQTPET